LPPVRPINDCRNTKSHARQADKAVRIASRPVRAPPCRAPTVVQTARP
jgi:hypothetical protein